MSSADIIVGLAWGDEGKGATVDAIAAHRPTDRVVRFNGGPQAGHNVIVSGVHHTFQSYGSATMCGVPTWLSHYCTVEPTAALAEREALKSKGIEADLINVDRRCLVTTPLHVAANRAREAARGDNKHGSTGLGFGETIAYSLDHPDAAPRAADLFDLATWNEKLDLLCDFYVERGLVTDDLLWIARELADKQLTSSPLVLRLVTGDDLLSELGRGHTIFEGAQGLWLDENYGTSPHTTWSTTTPANARRLARAAGIGDVVTIGCLRTYATRHGAGPFPHEGTLDARADEPHNADTDYAGVFRTAVHDPALIKAAIDITMVDALAISHTDIFPQFQTSAGPAAVDSFLPVLITSAGPSREHRRGL